MIATGLNVCFSHQSLTVRGKSCEKLRLYGTDKLKILCFDVNKKCSIQNVKKQIEMLTVETWHVQI